MLFCTYWYSFNSHVDVDFPGTRRGSRCGPCGGSSSGRIRPIAAPVEMVDFDSDEDDLFSQALDQSNVSTENNINVYR